MKKTPPKRQFKNINDKLSKTNNPQVLELLLRFGFAQSEEKNKELIELFLKNKRYDLFQIYFEQQRTIPEDLKVEVFEKIVSFHIEQKNRLTKKEAEFFINCAELLLKNGLCLGNLIDNKYSLLWFLFQQNSLVEYVELVLDNKADINLNINNRHLITYLVSKGEQNVFDYIIQRYQQDLEQIKIFKQSLQDLSLGTTTKLNLNDCINRFQEILISHEKKEITQNLALINEKQNTKPRPVKI